MPMKTSTLGRVGEADRLIEEGVRQARDSRHLFSIGHALPIRAMVANQRREPEVAPEYAQESVTLCGENGFALWLFLGRLSRGWAVSEMGQIEQGIADMEAGRAHAARMAGVPGQPGLLAELAKAYGRIGQTAKALAMLEQALAHCERTGEKRDLAELLRIKGEMLLVRDSGAIVPAESCFRAALDVARAQEAKWWQLRAAVSLSRLLRDSDRHDEARTMLAEIYNWFTEGFELPDLKEAKELLDELNG
jgi:predicted ATPase